MTIACLPARRLLPAKISAAVDVTVLAPVTMVWLSARLLPDSVTLAAPSDTIPARVSTADLTPLNVASFATDDASEASVLSVASDPRANRIWPRVASLPTTERSPLSAAMTLAAFAGFVTALSLRAPISVSRSAARTANLLSMTDRGWPFGPYKTDRAAPFRPGAVRNRRSFGCNTAGLGAHRRPF